jgi:hypothetical protein
MYLAVCSMSQCKAAAATAEDVGIANIGRCCSGGVPPIDGLDCYGLILSEILVIRGGACCCQLNYHLS